jgi:hypothetical protein
MNVQGGQERRYLCAVYRLFQGGEPREFQPSMAIVADLTGDGADDVVLLCHDRVLLYPQTRKSR